MVQERLTINGTFTVDDLGVVRAAVVQYASEAGLNDEGVAMFVIAVSEAVNNVILYAAGEGDLILTTVDYECSAEIRDRGPGFAQPDLVELPPSDATHGRGLWLMRRCADRFTLTSGADGTVVRLAITLTSD